MHACVVSKHSIFENLQEQVKVKESDHQTLNSFVQSKEDTKAMEIPQPPQSNDFVSRGNGQWGLSHLTRLTPSNHEPSSVPSFINL